MLGRRPSGDTKVAPNVHAGVDKARQKRTRKLRAPKRSLEITEVYSPETS
jgi:hypothetical protein